MINASTSKILEKEKGGPLNLDPNFKINNIIQTWTNNKDNNNYKIKF